MNMRRKLVLILPGRVAALALGSLAWAAIPDGNGVIHGCYDKGSGDLRVTDPQTNVPKACKIGEQKLDWNAQGPKGDPGPQGPAGAPGADPRADAFVERYGAGV